MLHFRKFTLSGSYRKIMQIPQTLEWNIIRFNNKTADLILSDLDKLRAKEEVKHEPGILSQLHFFK